MKMHGCVFGMEHFGRGHHGPRHFGHHGKHFGHGHKHGHHGHHGPMHGHHGPMQGHHGPKHGHHGGPHGFGMLGLGPRAFAFGPHGDHHGKKPGPEFGGPKSMLAPGMFDRFIDENGFEWRLHLSKESGSDSSKSSEDESGSDKEQSGCRRWGKHGGRGRHHRGFKHLAEKRHEMRKGKGGKGCKCKCTCEKKGEGEKTRDEAAPAESGPQIQEIEEAERPSTV